MTVRTLVRLPSLEGSRLRSGLSQSIERRCSSLAAGQTYVDWAAGGARVDSRGRWDSGVAGRGGSGWGSWVAGRSSGAVGDGGSAAGDGNLLGDLNGGGLTTVGT